MHESFSLNDLLGFLKLAQEKGWAKPATVASWRSACERVFGALDDAEKLDVRRIDVANAIQRFHNKNPSVAGPSLKTYQSRAKTAVSEFLRWKSDPKSWSPGRPRQKNGKARASKGHMGAQSAALIKAAGGGRSVDLQTPGEERGLSYPFPLRKDVTITITNIPRDLKIAECERLAAFLRSLAEDFPASK